MSISNAMEGLGQFERQQSLLSNAMEGLGQFERRGKLT